MKKVLKTTSVFIALVLILTACSNTDITGQVKSSQETTDTAGTVTEPTVTEETVYETGSTNGGTYTNSFLKIGCKLDENWTYYNEEQLAEVSGIAVDSIQNEDLSNNLEESLDNGKVIYDMYAASSDGLATINIMFENLGVVYGVALDESEYVDVSLDTAKETLESMGIVNITVEKTSVEFAGESRNAIVMSGEVSDIPIYETLICIKRGNYMADITLCSLSEDITDYLAGMFYTIE